MNLFAEIRALVIARLDDMVAAGQLPAGLDMGAVAVEPPRDALHGDMATNAAMVLARPAGLQPRAIAEALAARLAADPHSAAEIRAMDGPIIRFSKPLYQNLKAIKSFLFTRMYRAPSVVAERQRVTAMVNDLFPLFLNDPALLPPEWREDVARVRDRTGLARVVLDYVAGMTDRFAIQECERLCGG